jgi:hypothetical protein
MGLVFAVTSYDGRVIISPTSCREQVPDPDFFALCIRESFQEYLALADRAAPRRAQNAGNAAGKMPGKSAGKRTGTAAGAARKPAAASKGKAKRVGRARRTAA